MALADRIIANGPPASAGELLDILRLAPRDELYAAAHCVTTALPDRPSPPQAPTTPTTALSQLKRATMSPSCYEVEAIAVQR